MSSGFLYNPFPSMSAGDLLKFRLCRPGRSAEPGQKWQLGLLLEQPRPPKWGNYPYTFTLLLNGQLAEMSEERLEDVTVTHITPTKHKWEAP